MLYIIGHRGARGLAPENTLAAITAGLQARVDAIEVDVRVTKDGVSVLCHNRRLNGHKITDKSLNELREKNTNLATLEEAIQTVNHRCSLYIEVKRGEKIQPVAAVVQKFLSQGWRAQDFMLASKGFRTLKALHQALPEVPVAVIERWSGVRASWRARRLGTNTVIMNYHFMWFGFIRSMRRKYELSVYPLNDPAKAERWATYGLHGVVTDFPDRFKKDK